MNLFVAGLSYKTAPVELREQLAVHASQWRACGARLKQAGNLLEVVLISTCNRVEIYGVTREAGLDVQQLFGCLSRDRVELASCLYVKHGAEAVRHLFSVAGGLDSMVVGETEITGQVKQAYQAAQEAGLTGRVLNRVFQAALQTAKEIRSRTGVGRGATSVGSVAVELAERIFDMSFSEKTVMILGAGKMGETCVRHLNKKGARSVLVSNRSFERARALALEFGGQAVPFEDCLSAMERADIVVSSTGCPETILHREDIARVMAARRQRPLVLIDIAVPRDIAPDVQEIPGVYLYDVDDLEVVVRENVRLREQELSRCGEIIADRARAVLARLADRAVDGVVRPALAPSGFSLFQPATCGG
jgi:glutamyl-tRNA reductase